MKQKNVLQKTLHSLFLIFVIFFVSDRALGQATLTYTPASNTNTVNTINLPASTCYSTVSFTAQCWGGGGAGGGSATGLFQNSGSGGGGSGAGFAQGTITVTLSSSATTPVYYDIGAGGTGGSDADGNPGGNTWFNSANGATTGNYYIEATGGSGGKHGNKASGASQTTVGTGAFGSSVTSSSYHTGGTGAGGNDGATGGSGGGGGGAGSGYNGTNGSENNVTGGGGGAGGNNTANSGGGGGSGLGDASGNNGSSGGGGGGGGGSTPSNYSGGAGGAPGGGGGGGFTVSSVGSSQSGGGGGAGQIVITYIQPAPTISSLSPSTYCGTPGANLVITGCGFYDIVKGTNAVSSVTINGTSVAYTVNSATQITVAASALSSVTTGTVEVITSGGNTGTTGNTLSVVAQPAIATNPTASQTVCQGATVTLSASATNHVPSGTFSYQWYYNNTTNSTSGGTACTGTGSSGTGLASATATNFTLPTSNATTASPGGTGTAGGPFYYYCVFTPSSGSGCNSVTTTAAGVTVLSQPAIATNPSTQTACQGSTVTLSASATNYVPSGTFSYQWYYNGTTNSTSGGTACTGTGNSGSGLASGATTSFTLATSNASTASPGGTGVTGGPFYYYCVFTPSSGTGCNSTTSTAAGVTVAPQPAIATNPTSQTVCAGGTVSLTASATNYVSGGTFSYQWYYNNTTNSNSGGIPCTGAGNSGSGLASGASTSFTLATSNATTASPGGTGVAGGPFYYYCVFTPSSGTGCSPATTSAIGVTVASDPSWATISPPSTPICAGGSVTFSATVNNGVGNTITWTRAAASLGAGTTVTSGDMPPFAGSYYYYPVYTSSVSGCTLATTTAQQTAVTVATDPSWGTITPPASTLCQGSGVTFSAAVNNGAGNTVTWTRSTSSLGAGVTVTSPDSPSSVNSYYYYPVYTSAISGCSLATTTAQQTEITEVSRPTASFAGGASVVCLGSTETYTVALTGTAPWTYTIDTAGGLINGTTSISPISFSISPRIAKTIKVSALSDANCTSIYSDLDSINVTETTNCTITWVGSTSSNWNTASNWNPILVPNSCSVDAVIPAGTPNSPVISSGNIQVGNLTIASPQSITLNGYNLSVCKNLLGNYGVYLPGSGNLVFDGSVPQNVTGTIHVDGVVFDNTSTPVGSNVVFTNYTVMSVYRGASLQAGNVNVTTSNAALTLLSTNVDSAAYLNDFTGGYTGTFTGNLIAHRQVAVTGTAWQHEISSPVNGATFYQMIQQGNEAYGYPLTDAYLIPSSNCSEDSISYLSPYSSAFTWNEGNVNVTTPCITTGWQTVGYNDSWIPGKGYSVYLNSGSNLYLEGQPNTGTITLSGCTNGGWSFASPPTAGNPTSHTDNSGWSMVGNPYPSGLNISATSTGFDGQVQVFHPSGTYLGTYNPVQLTTSTLHLAPYQAFMAHKTAVGGTATWTFNQSGRTTNVGTQYQFYELSEDAMTIQVKGNGFADMTRLEFNAGATDGFDVDYDADKFQSNQGQPTLYTVIPGYGPWGGINVMGPLVKNTTVPLGMQPGADGTFTLSFDPADLAGFPASVSIYLEDKQNPGNWVNVRTTNSYTFTSKASDQALRFALHFSPEGSSGISSTNASTDINIFSAANSVMVDFSRLQTVDATIQIYDVLGQQLSNEEYHTADIYSKAITSVEAAYVIVMVRMDDGQITSKKLFLTK